ncbi:MAG: hypothetical protein A2900_05730 [Candidatus Chisholmbacteria bacterium RIFCSPLOWO2_01_FULL_50_28]|uniref:Uncharacterized protein n=1 Tax=Candidatus Chisholmbacteria bacterium RIFCSPHIGHO2_01_FULL_52_32 TaxID=1797591 RepID=A0A1G1VQN8_9BACT|nr:MAG: hypothetical protein A2786_05500 [Candidatus Chisholmbacteria bacterium RIFCSPHIGHO2_01_FULL_52_32]OGY20538.1 MAG: hypothetical protein A2900_05730 [Candidatus Chisholmbacteria bacterium RIFCSPLOWO2_01_FULL_50_28]
MRRIVRLLLSGSFLWMVSPVFASEPPQDVLFSSQIFQKFDIKLVNDVGLILPVIVAWFAIKVASLMRGGKLEHVWKLIAAGMSVLALVKVVDGLENLGILYVGGLRSVLEFVMILVFLSAFVLAYQSLEMAIRGPIPVENPKIELPSDKASEASGKKEKK